jgi:hypothetical protein
MPTVFPAGKIFFHCFLSMLEILADQVYNSPKGRFHSCTRGNKGDKSYECR